MLYLLSEKLRAEINENKIASKINWIHLILSVELSTWYILLNLLRVSPTAKQSPE